MDKFKYKIGDVVRLRLRPEASGFIVARIITEYETGIGYTYAIADPNINGEMIAREMEIEITTIGEALVQRDK